MNCKHLDYQARISKVCQSNKMLIIRGKMRLKTKLCPKKTAPKENL